MRGKSAPIIRGEQGQTLLMFVLFMIVLIVFIGLGVDMGFAYMTRARLSKAVDSACLTGMRNLSQGKPAADKAARAAFSANYGTSGRDVPPGPAVVVNFGTVNNNAVIDVKATDSINTYFIRVLPLWKTLAVGSSAQATRADVNMTLVLDTSGSMDPKRGPPPGGDDSGSGGGKYLPAAVTTFINNFDDTLDSVGMVKFSVTQSDVVYAGNPHQPTAPFKNAIITAVNAFVWNGATFSQGGLTNGLAMENSATIPPLEKVIKVVVFCTDGLANIVQDHFSCPASTTLNFGGQDAGTGVGFYDPSSGNQLCWLNNGGSPSCCSAVSQFKSAINGSMQPFLRPNVSADAEFRAVQVANEMRKDGIIVYAIGVGTHINADFLAQVANDPSAPGYVATSYDGAYVVANDVSQLSSVFQAIADKILLRLSK